MSLTQTELDLYQQVILDHNRSPRNFCELENPSLCAEGFNPLCGDHLWIYIRTDENDVIRELSFQGSGCAISKASASMMTTSLIGKTLAEADHIFEEFRALITGDLEPEQSKNLGKLKIFSGICRYPSRVKCAGLAWHTMHGALTKVDKVSTEE